MIIAAFIFMTGFAFVQAQALEPRGADLCKAIPDQGMQARCYETLNAFGNQREGYRAELPGGWHLSKMQNANGGPDVVSVLHAADFRNSDLNLAGILLQCAGGPVNVLLVVIQPYPPGTTIDVTLKFDNASGFTYLGSVVPPGIMIGLPAEAAASLLRRERSAEELRVQLSYEKGSDIKGIVKLVGFAGAIDALKAMCSGH